MRITRKVYISVASVLVAVGALVALNVTSTTSQAISSYRDCEADTIIKCGALTEAELLQKYDANVGDVQHVYPHYGINRSDLAGQTSQIKHGTVYQDGRVVVDGKTVATNAYSVSRIRFSSQSRAVTINGTTYYEGPNMSIFVQSVDAYVYMRNGQFYRAVLSACGNPLMATPVQPPVQPVYSCDSLKATKIDRTRFKFTTAATAKNGAAIAHYTYDFGDGKTSTTNDSTVEHTYAKPGKYTVKVSVNVSINGVRKEVTSANCQTTITVEELPKTPVYTCDSLTATKIDRTNFKFTTAATAKDGAEIVSYTYNFGDSKTQTVTGTSVNHTYDKPGTYTISVTVNVKVNGVAKTVTSDKCKVTIKVESVPVTPTYACDTLKSEKINRTTFKFTAAASAAGGAEIVSYNYDFGDTQKQTVNSTSVTHVYSKPGTYTAKVTVNVKVNGETKVVSGANCQTTVKIEEVPVTPVYSCDSLTATKIDRTNFKFTSAATAKNGAEIVNYMYDFGDGQKQTVTGTTVNHTYAQPGTYTVKLTVTVKVNGETKVVSGDKCQTTVKVENVPVTPTYVCESLNAEKINRTTFKFTSAASAAGGAEIVSYSYNFGDSHTQVTSSNNVTHTYAQPGTYTVKVSVNVKVNGETKVVTSENCQTTIKVENVPVTPAYACDSLTIKRVDNKELTYAYTLTYTAEGGATLKKVVYDFGDSKNATFTAAQATHVEHAYESAGTYKTTATLYFDVQNGETTVEKTVNCEVSITISPEMCTMPGKENFPKNSPECAEKPEMCTMPGKETLPKNSPECVEQHEMCDIPGKETLPKDSKECVVLPPELPQTGIGDLLSGGLGLGSLTAAGYYWVNSRKSLLKR